MHTITLRWNANNADIIKQFFLNKLIQTISASFRMYVPKNKKLPLVRTEI